MVTVVVYSLNEGAKSFVVNDDSEGEIRRAIELFCKWADCKPENVVRCDVWPSTCQAGVQCYTTVTVDGELLLDKEVKTDELA